MKELYFVEWFDEEEKQEKIKEFNSFTDADDYFCHLVVDRWETCSFVNLYKFTNNKKDFIY